jgi:hypothetical protein
MALVPRPCFTKAVAITLPLPVSIAAAMLTVLLYGFFHAIISTNSVDSVGYLISEKTKRKINGGVDSGSKDWCLARGLLWL